jgi:small subunit ribosomal protein S6
LKPYEIMLLLDSELADERQAEILTRIRGLVEQRGGSWQGQDDWGRRKLAYEIDHKGEAFYHLLRFDCDAATLEELTRVLKITDGVLRHMAVRRLAPGATQSAREHAPRGPRPRESVPSPEYDRTDVRLRS